MLLEGAIGDAYGAGFEFADMDKINQKNNLKKYESHPLYHHICGHYTDDNQMAIAIAELLLKEEDWTPVSIANKFVEVFKRDIRKGYAKGFYAFLISVKDGQDFLQKIKPNSERNGAMMRVYPLGILDNEREILEKASLQANITHQTNAGRVSAQAIALTTHYFIYNKGDKKNLLEYLSEWQQYNWSACWQGEISMNAIDTTNAVLSLLLSCNTLSQLLKKSVAFGGDVDTVASLCLAIASTNKKIKCDLPKWLYTDLENNTYGTDFLKKIDSQLLNKYLK